MKKVLLYVQQESRTENCRTIMDSNYKAGKGQVKGKRKGCHLIQK